MLEKISQKDESHIKGTIRNGEVWAQALFSEALDLYKMSAAQDPDMPLIIERLLDHLSSPFQSQDFATNEEREWFDKRSSAPGYFKQFHDEVVVGEDFSRQERLKQSQTKESVLGDFTRALTDPNYQARRTAASLGGGRAPARQGEFSWRDPMFDVTRGLREVDENSMQAFRYAALSPAERAKQGIYFKSDLPALARDFKPQPRSLREATLLGTQEGIRRANTADPGVLDKAKFWLAQNNARRLAEKAQRQRIHGEYPGLFGTLERDMPTWRTRAGDVAADLGSKVRNLHPLAKAGLAGAGALGGALGLREAIQAGQDRQNRINIAVEANPLRMRHDQESEVFAPVEVAQ